MLKKCPQCCKECCYPHLSEKWEQSRWNTMLTHSPRTNHGRSHSWNRPHLCWRKNIHLLSVFLTPSSIHSYIHSVGISPFIFFTYLFVGAGPVCTYHDSHVVSEDSMQESLPSYYVCIAHELSGLIKPGLQWRFPWSLRKFTTFKSHSLHPSLQSL